MYAPMTHPADTITTAVNVAMGADMFARSEVDQANATATLYGHAGQVVTIEHDATAPAHLRYVLQTYATAEDFANRLAWDCHATQTFRSLVAHLADFAESIN